MRLTCSALIRQYGREDLVPDLVQAIIGRQYGNNGCVRELAVTGELAIIATCLDGYTRLEFKRPVVGGRNGSSADGNCSRHPRSDLLPTKCQTSKTIQPRLHRYDLSGHRQACMRRSFNLS